MEEMGIIIQKCLGHQEMWGLGDKLAHMWEIWLSTYG